MIIKNTIHKNELIGLSPNSNKFKIYKESLPPLTLIQKETLIGLLLGDASLQTLNKGETFRIKFEWGCASRAYLNHVYNVFNNYCISQPHCKERMSPKGNKVINYGFQTLSHKHLVFYSNLFMYKPKKSLNLKLLKNELTPRSLAYWLPTAG